MFALNSLHHKPTQTQLLSLQEGVCSEGKNEKVIKINTNRQNQAEKNTTPSLPLFASDSPKPGP